MNPISIVFGKEVLDGRRDKRAVMSALIFPVLAPAFVYFMITALVGMQTESRSTTIQVEGSGNAPGLVQWLQEQDVSIESFDGDAKSAVTDQQAELVLIIPDDFQSRLASGKTAMVELVQDSSRTDARSTVDRLSNLLEQYSRQVASLRLIARGMSPELIGTLSIETVDVASKQQRAAAGLSFIPLYIMMAAFVSGMGIAIDTTAGERERKSLEPLLINPAERFQIVAGKWLAASLFSTIGLVLTAVLCIVAMLQAPLEEIGLGFSVSPLQLTAMILGTAPLAFLATSLQLFLGMFAKSFKDAQSYMGILVILPIIPSMMTLFSPMPTEDWMFAVPILGQHLLLAELIGGETIPAVAYVYSAASCLVIGFGFVLATARLFQRESIIAG